MKMKMKMKNENENENETIYFMYWALFYGFQVQTSENETVCVIYRKT